MPTSLADMQIASRHLWIIIVHGLAADTEPVLNVSALPNFRTIERMGMRVERCLPDTGSSAAQALATLLFGAPSGEPEGKDGLAAVAARAGRVVFQLLPWQPDRWIAERTRGSSWSIVENRLDQRAADWRDVLAGEPELLADPDGDAELAAFFRDRIVARFPGRATMMREVSDGQLSDGLASWMEWAGDAFLRSIWYLSSRASGGLLGLLTYPAPALLAERDGVAGYRQGLQALDDLLGRLLLLREHEDLADSALIVCGNGAHPSADRTGQGAVPLLAVASDLDHATRIAETSLDEVAAFFARSAATPPSEGPGT